MDPGGGVQQSHDEVQSGQKEFYIFNSVNYILTFQAGLTVIEVDFKAEKEDDEPKPLKMKHFYFPLGVLLGGLILSAIFLLAEIILHSIRKPETEVAIAKLEEQSVTQSSPESEKLEKMVLNTEGAELDLAVSENI